MLTEGAENIARWSGRYPVAFRGGGFHSDLITLKVLKALNIPIESSLNSPHHVLAEVYPINRVAVFDGLVELPVFVYTENLLFKRRHKVLDTETLSLREMIALTDTAVAHDVRTLVVIMHSFSFCRDYYCPLKDNAEKFKRFLDYLAGRADIEVITVRQFWKRYQKQPESFVGSGFEPQTGYAYAVYRSFARFNHGLEYRLFALTNVGIAVVLMVILVLFLRCATAKRQRATRPCR